MQERLSGAQKLPASNVVLEDAGDHSLRLQEKLFELLWPLVRIGGWYLIEDVDPQRGGLAFTQDHDALGPMLRRVLEENRAFMTDTSVGIPTEQWKVWQKSMSGPGGTRGYSSKFGNVAWVKDRKTHNSHVLVIRKLKETR